jgi:4-amino-4-deoxy-L-arabinose transferase-like glycosyltransferase
MQSRWLAKLRSVCRSLAVTEWAILLALGLIALALRAIRWSLTPVMFNDGPIFIEISRAMSAGDWATALSYDQHPLYSFLTMFAQRAIGDWELAGAVVSIGSGVAAVLFLYALLRDAFDRQVAWIGALLLGFHPYALTYSADVQSDGLYLAAFVGALALLWKAIDRRSSWFAASAGLASGVAYLVRPEGAGVVLIGLGLVLLESVRRRWTLRSAAPWVIALGLGTALAMAPYVTLLSERHGTLTFTQKKSLQNLLGIDSFRNWIRFDSSRIQGETSPVASLSAPVQLTPRLTSVVGDGSSARGTDPPILSELVQNALSSARYEILLLVLLGLWGLRGPIGLRGRFVLLAFIIYSAVLYALLTQVGYVSRRHTLPVSVLAFGYAAAGVPILGRGLLRATRAITRSLRPIDTRQAIAVGLIVVLGLALGKGMRPHRQNAVAERRAAEWLGALGTKGHGVAAGKHRVAFYADAPWVDLRSAPANALLPYLLERDARYLVVDEDENSRLLERTPYDPARLLLLHTEEAHGHTALVYDLVPPASSQILE